MAEQAEYAVVVDGDPEKLGAKVTELLGKDWQPCGGLCALPTGLAQAVVRDPTRADSPRHDPRVEAHRVRKTSLDD